MSFSIYMVGVVTFTAGLIFFAVLMNVPAPWILIGALLLLGFSVLIGGKGKRQKGSLS